MFWIAKRNLNLRDECSRVQQNLLENEYEYVALGGSVVACCIRRSGGAVPERDQCQSGTRPGSSIVGDPRFIGGEHPGAVADHAGDAFAIAVDGVHRQGAAVDVGRWCVWGVFYFTGAGI